MCLEENADENSEDIDELIRETFEFIEELENDERRGNNELPNEEDDDKERDTLQKDNEGPSNGFRRGSDDSL